MQDKSRPSIWYDDSGQRYKITHPTSTQLMQLIEQLNNETKTFVAINQATTGITICGGNSNRVSVLFQSVGQGYGKLVDKDSTSDDEIYIAIEDNLDPEPFRLTVTKEIAYQV